MTEQEKQLRECARDCRHLAKGARNEADRAMLEEIAAELDAEADRIYADSVRPEGA